MNNAQQDQFIHKIFSDRELNKPSTMFETHSRIAAFLYYSNLSKKTKLKLRLRYWTVKRIPIGVLQDLARKTLRRDELQPLSGASPEKLTGLE